MTKMNDIYMNLNQLRVLAENLDRWEANDQFHLHVKNDDLDWRDLSVTVAYADQPGTTTLVIDRNGDIVSRRSGGLD